MGEMNEKRSLKFVFVVFVFICLLAPSVFAVGLGVSPSSVDFGKIHKGETREATVLVSTTSFLDLVVMAKPSGEMEGWIFFSDNITNFTISKGNPYRLKVVIVVPNSTRNDNYSSEIVLSAIQEQDKGKELVTTIKTELGMRIGAEVIGNENIECLVGGHYAKDMEQGYPFEFGYTIENKGTVTIAPEVSIAAWGENAQKALIEKSFKSDESRPKNRTLTKRTIMLPDLTPGKYFVKIDIPECGSQKVLEFNVLKPGEIADIGRFEEVKHPGTSSISDFIPIEAVFRNDGVRLESVQYVGELYLNGNKIKTIESARIDVLEGEEKKFEIVFKPEQEGKYQVIHYFLYNNKKTEEKTTSISVINATSQRNRLLFIVVMFCIVAAVLVLLILITKHKIKKRNKSNIEQEP